MVFSSWVLPPGGAARPEEERESSDSDSSSPSSESSKGSKNEDRETKQKGKKTKTKHDDKHQDTQKDEEKNSDLGPEWDICNLSFLGDGNDPTCKNVILVGKEARPEMTCWCC